MDFHGEVEEATIGVPNSKQTVLIMLHAKGEPEPHAFYLTAAAVDKIVTKLTIRQSAKALAIQKQFWMAVGQITLWRVTPMGYLRPLSVGRLLED